MYLGSYLIISTPIKVPKPPVLTLTTLPAHNVDVALNHDSKSAKVQLQRKEKKKKRQPIMQKPHL